MNQAIQAVGSDDANILNDCDVMSKAINNYFNCSYLQR